MEEDAIFADFQNIEANDLIPDWANDEITDQELVDRVVEVERQHQSRFPSLEDEDLQQIVSDAVAKNTKRSTRWSVKIFTGKQISCAHMKSKRFVYFTSLKQSTVLILHNFTRKPLTFIITDWCKERRIEKEIQNMTEEELDEHLWRFYGEARSQTGEEYSRSTFLGIRNALERYLATYDRHIKITKNPVFRRSNKMLESKLKRLRREGKENVQHKPVIEQADLVKIQNSPFTSPDNPSGLLRKTWFFVTLHWCRRGFEGQRNLRRNSFEFKVDAEGQEYVVMTHQELSKNHQGGFQENKSDEILTRLYSTGTPDDAYSCLKLYLSKLNPRQEAFYQRPKPSVQSTDTVWYENKPLGVNKLASMMKEISTGAGLSKIYTNHSVRATAITVLSNNSVPTRHIMSISGHSNEQSLSSYNSRPSADQLKRCSAIISAAVTTESSSIQEASSP